MTPRILRAAVTAPTRAGVYVRFVLKREENRHAHHHPPLQLLKLRHPGRPGGGDAAA